MHSSFVFVDKSYFMSILIIELITIIFNGQIKYIKSYYIKKNVKNYTFFYLMASIF